jgi:single-strand DNA-binding protein
MNRATLLGHLGADPEKRFLSSGDPVWNLRLATSDTWRDKTTGERKEATEWHSIVVYNDNIGKVIEQYTRKGSRILIEGKIKTRKYQDQAGHDRYRTDVVVERYAGMVQLLDRAERQAPPEPGDYGQTRTRGDAPRTVPQAGADRYDPAGDDVPF